MRFDIILDKSKQLTLLILLLAAIGLTGIYIAVKNINPVELRIEDIDNSLNGRLVRIIGSIDNIRKSSSGNSYWTVDDGSNITVPILDNQFKKLTPVCGDIVEIIGLVTEYKGELEIMPKEIYFR